MSPDTILSFGQFLRILTLRSRLIEIPESAIRFALQMPPRWGYRGEGGCVSIDILKKHPSKTPAGAALASA